MELKIEERNCNACPAEYTREEYHLLTLLVVLEAVHGVFVAFNFLPVWRKIPYRFKLKLFPQCEARLLIEQFRFFRGAPCLTAPCPLITTERGLGSRSTSHSLSIALYRVSEGRRERRGAEYRVYRKLWNAQ